MEANLYSIGSNIYILKARAISFWRVYNYDNENKFVITRKHIQIILEA
jgi:hypothetical protein